MTGEPRSAGTNVRRRPSPAHLPLIVGCLLMVAPFAYMISRSLMTTGEVFAADAGLLPKNPQFAAYADALSKLGLGRSFVNSLIVTVPVVVGGVLTSAMAGFAFARLEFVGRRLWLIFILATIMVPVQAKYVALYVGFAEVGLLDTFWPLILPGVLSNAFGVFLMRQYFLTYPRTMDEAAELDGANPWQFFWHIALPQARAALGALALFTFLGTWNDFFGPLIFLTSPELYTVPVAVARALGLYGTDWPVLMAASTIAIGPSVVVFLLLRRQIVAGVSFAGAVR